MTIFLVLIIPMYNTHTAEFNPEDYVFSKKETIRNWLSPDLCNEEYLCTIQSWIAEEMPQNTPMFTNSVTCLIRNNDGDKRYFGKNFPTIAMPQLAFLQAIKQHQDSNDKPPVVIEFGAGSGRFSYKIKLALGNKGKLIVNDLSKYETEGAKALFNKGAQLTSFNSENVIFDTGDAAAILERHPDFEGTIDLCYVQNVEHFMNPVEHQNFLKTVLKLLASNGKVFCTANTIPVGYGKKGNRYFDLYIELKKKQIIYPMFLKYEKTVKQIIHTNAFVSNDHLEVVRLAKDDEQCYSKGRDTGRKEYHMMYGPCYVIEQSNLMNQFTPTIWHNAFKKAAESLPGCCVEKMDGYFSDTLCETKSYEFDNTKYLVYASVVMKKIN
jgi:SAM-dependent methyltransferase